MSEVAPTPTTEEVKIEPAAAKPLAPTAVVVDSTPKLTLNACPLPEENEIVEPPIPLTDATMACRLGLSVFWSAALISCTAPAAVRFPGVDKLAPFRVTDVVWGVPVLSTTEKVSVCFWLTVAELL